MIFKNLMDYDSRRRPSRKGTKLAELLRYNLNSGLFAIYAIVGQRGAGKSSYALTAMYEFFSASGRAPSCSVLLKHVYIEPERLINDLTDHYAKITEKCGKSLACVEKNKIPLVLLDDAGLFFSKYLWHEDRHATIAFHKLLQPIRMVVSNFILTVPTIEDLVVALRNSPDAYLIYVERANPKEALVRIYSPPHITPKRLKIRRFLLSHERIKLEAPCYEEYLAIRKEITAKGLIEAKTVFDLTRSDRVDKKKAKKLAKEIPILEQYLAEEPPEEPEA